MFSYYLKAIYQKLGPRFIYKSIFCNLGIGQVYTTVHKDKLFPLSWVLKVLIKYCINSFLKVDQII